MLGFVEGKYFLHQREMNAMHIYLLEMTAYKIKCPFLLMKRN